MGANPHLGFHGSWTSILARSPRSKFDRNLTIHGGIIAT